MRSRGFTLLEVLLAMIIMAGGMLLITNTWSGNAARILKTRINHNIATLLEQKMIELELEYREKPLDVPEEDAGDFGKNYPGYRWELESRELQFPDLSSLMSGREGEGPGEMEISIVRSMSSYLKQVAKEVRVTVFFEQGGKKTKTPIKHALTTYFIDYNKEASIDGLPSGGGAPAGGAAGGSSGGAPAGGGTGGGGTP